MQGVRYPAIAFGVGTSLLTFVLTRRLFGSDGLALGAVLLNHIVPMFVAGSVLMTIDPPMFFCWALATYFAALAVFDGRKWAWPRRQNTWSRRIPNWSRPIRPTSAECSVRLASRPARSAYALPPAAEGGISLAATPVGPRQEGPLQSRCDDAGAARVAEFMEALYEMPALAIAASST